MNKIFTPSLAFLFTIFFLLTCSLSVFSQELLFSENFESYSRGDLSTSSGASHWRMIEIDGSANDWGIGEGGSVISGARSLTIRKGSTDFSYGKISETCEIIAMYNQAIDAGDWQDLKLNFKWKCDGENNDDYGMLVWSTDGTNWQNVNSTKYQNNASVQTVSNLDFSAADGTQFYIGFKWINDFWSGDNPPFTIDDLEIRGTAPPIDYPFSYRLGSYNEIAGTTSTATGDDGAENISLPFTFNYCGKDYATARISVNGWLEMGQTYTSTGYSNNLSIIDNQPLIAPLWDDLYDDATSVISYETSGTAPNRIFTVQWKNVLWRLASGTRQNFQVKLYESINIIEFVYGSMTAPSNSPTASIGIKDSYSGSNHFMSITPASAPAASKTVVNNSINSIDYLPEGQIYTFGNAQATSFDNSGKLAYPIIFVHGLAGGDETFKTTMEYLRDNYDFGNINVFDVVLNADNNTTNSLMANDVKWQDFSYGGRSINVGRRNFRSDIGDFQDGWTDSLLFAVNFKEERIRGAQGTWNDYFDYGDQAGIFKQGYALNKVISDVLAYTQKEKVVLIAHSMGGLCIREYLQRTNGSGSHVNWIDPSDAYGHKVARVVTIGTPHLGSNSGFDPTKKDGKTENNTKSALPDQNQEALRDMKYSYDSYTNCGGTPQGIYMFGGNENCIKGSLFNPTFDNVDINCDGDETDDIVGINSGTSYNPAMPLPTNIKYTWITSDVNMGECATCLGTGIPNGVDGDGSVLLSRQWLYSGTTPAPLPVNGVLIADRMLAAKKHTDEGASYYEIIKGMDEPASRELSYGMDYNKKINGFITYQFDGTSTDTDMYHIENQQFNTITAVIDKHDSSSPGVTALAVLDNNGTVLSSIAVSSYPSSISLNIPSGISRIYIQVTGTATASTWQHPYALKVFSGSWLGVASSDWHNLANWKMASIPTATSPISIPASAPNQPIIDAHATCKEVYIAAGATLTVNPQKNFTVTGKLTVNGTLNLKSDATGTASLIDNGTVENFGTINVEKYLVPDSWHYISSPVIAATHGIFSGGVLVAYDETKDDYWLTNSNNISGESGWSLYQSNLTRMQGYGSFFWGTAKTVTFSGSLNTGYQSINLHYSAGTVAANFYDGWNLLGNPYPSAIDWNLVDKTGISDAALYYYMGGDLSRYDNYLYYISGIAGSPYPAVALNGGSQYIPAMQGFFVRTTQDGYLFSLDNSSRVHSSQAFYKDDRVHPDLLRLQIAQGDYRDETIIRFIPDAGKEHDARFDAFKLFSRNKKMPQIYSRTNSYNKLAINTLQNINIDLVIPLGVKFGQVGMHTISATELNFDLNQDVYLEDTYAKKLINLREQSEYSFHVQDTLLLANRFKIRFAKAGEKPTSTENSARVFYENGFINLIFSGTEAQSGTLSIYNTAGMKLASETFSEVYSFEFPFQAASGYYLVQISTKQVFSKKIVIK